MRTIFFMFLALTFLSACTGGEAKKAPKKTEATNVKPVENIIPKKTFGKMPDGKEIDLYTLKNSQGMEIDVISYGGIITRWTAPNSKGVYEDIALGYNKIEDYLKENPYFGALIGRYGNRIANGKFSLDGKEYTLATNNGANHLHGGETGFDKTIWNIQVDKSAKNPTLILSYTSADGEEGYPGKLESKVTYTLLENNELMIKYSAVTDKPTIVNLTQHTYFNLSADFSEPITDHVLSMDADRYLPVDKGLIPTGELAQVEGTPFDFRTPKPIINDIAAKNTQIEYGGGFDHCWVLNPSDKAFRQVATVYEPTSGRFLEVFTDEPGLQFYSGNFLDGTLPTKTEGTYPHRSGFCLETQHYPDSPNQKSFPSVRLNPGEVYNSQTSYRLSTK